MSGTSDHVEKIPAGRLGLYVQGLLAGTELPMFSGQLIELLALPVEDPASARKLVELVGEDYALTCKVLSIANSFRYNRSNHSIENIKHAIVVLGVSTVRNLASTLMCFQSSQMRSESLHQLMIRSMMSAQVAAETAVRGKLLDRDVAYLAGMLENLGEILVAHRTPHQHLAIQARVAAGSAREAASVNELAFTYDHLARVIGRHWKLPSSVCSLWDADQTSMDALLARFANELTRVMCLGAVANRDSAIALLLLRHGSDLDLVKEEVADIWDRALFDVRETFETLGVKIGPLGLPTSTFRLAS